MLDSATAVVAVPHREVHVTLLNASSANWRAFRHCCVHIGASGGSFHNRSRLAREIVERVRDATGKDFMIMFRLSMLDLVKDGSEWGEVVGLAEGLEAAGVSIINTGIGWHEARIPTIATSVPRGGFSWVTAKLKGAVSVPLVATNRINTPEIAEHVLSAGHSDLVSMARPFLADPFFLTKAEEGRADRINTCIACNQACLDHSFVMKRASCMVRQLNMTRHT